MAPLTQVPLPLSSVSPDVNNSLAAALQDIPNHISNASWVKAVGSLAAALHWLPFASAPLAAGQAQLAVLDCHMDDLPFFLHPFRATVGTSRAAVYLSCLFFNMIFLVAVALFNGIAAAIMRSVKGDVKGGQGAAMFPGLIWFGCMLVFPGSIVAGTRLMSSSWWAAGVVAHLCAVASVAIPLYLLRHIHRKAVYNQASKKSKLSSAFLGPGEWCSIDPHCVPRYGAIFECYTAARPLFFVTDVLFVYIICIAQGARDAFTPDQCGVKVIIQGICFLLYAILVAVARPFARPFRNVSIPLGALLIGIGLLVSGGGLKGGSDVSSARDVLIGMGLIVMVLTGFVSAGIWVYVKSSKRAKRCEGEEHTTGAVQMFGGKLKEQFGEQELSDLADAETTARSAQNSEPFEESSEKMASFNSRDGLNEGFLHDKIATPLLSDDQEDPVTSEGNEGSGASITPPTIPLVLSGRRKKATSFSQSADEPIVRRPSPSQVALPPGRRRGYTTRPRLESGNMAPPKAGRNSAISNDFGGVARPRRRGTVDSQQGTVATAASLAHIVYKSKFGKKAAESDDSSLEDTL